MSAISGSAVALVMVVLVVAAGAAYIFANQRVSTSASTATTEQHSSTSYNAGAASITTSTTAVLGPKAVLVEIPLADAEPGTDGTNQFNPQVITLVIGVNNTVTWTNLDEWPHNILTTSGFSSPDLATGQSYTFTFTRAGIYHYTCSYYPVMSGTVIVKVP